MIYVAVLLLLVVFFLTKQRYRWFYILYKTIHRDLKAIIRFINLNYFLLKWERNQMTVSKIFQENIKLYPDKIAIYLEDQRWTFREVDEFSEKVGTYFKNAGYVHGDTVGLLLPNSPEYVALWLGLSKIGVVTALINTNLTSDPLVHSIKAAKCKGLIFGSEYSDVVGNIKPKIGSINGYQFHEKPSGEKPILDGTIDLRKQINIIKAENLKNIIAKGKPRDKLVYIYTSGTTGLPKAAVITNVRFFFMTMGLHSMAAMKFEDIIYDPLPLYHSAGGIVGIGQCLLRGNSVVLRKKFSASNFWIDCAKYKCTAAQYIGEICRYLLAVPQKEPINHQVRIMFGNGLKAQIWKPFVDRFKVKDIIEFYGATEGNSNLVNIDNTEGAVGFVPRYAGALYPVTLVKCSEETGEALRNESGLCTRCNVGEPGVLIGKINPKKAVNQFAGYADKKATEKKIIENVFKKGDLYFNSGDILVQDEFGYYFFKDRTGDTFRWKGENVATTEIEAVISNVVNLSDAVVYGVQIPNTDGRAGMAAIVDPKKLVNMTDFAKNMKANLPSYAIPIFVRVMESVPMTGTFKLKKIDLQTEGFDINRITDDLYLYDPKTVTYKRLTKDVYDDIYTGKLRL